MMVLPPKHSSLSSRAHREGKVFFVWYRCILSIAIHEAHRSNSGVAIYEQSAVLLFVAANSRKEGFRSKRAYDLQEIRLGWQNDGIPRILPSFDHGLLIEVVQYGLELVSKSRPMLLKESLVGQSTPYEARLCSWNFGIPSYECHGIRSRQTTKTEYHPDHR